MAYAQWVVITIINLSTKEVVVKNICLPWGKFHKDSKSPVSSACVPVDTSWPQCLYRWQGHWSSHRGNWEHQGSFFKRIQDQILWSQAHAFRHGGRVRHLWEWWWKSASFLLGVPLGNQNKYLEDHQYVTSTSYTFTWTAIFMKYFNRA